MFVFVCFVLIILFLCLLFKLKIIMDISVTSLVNPFSFFCIPVEKDQVTNSNTNLTGNVNVAYDLGHLKRKGFSDVVQDEYLAVLVNNIWERGVVDLETSFQIWLVDRGYYLRPSETTVYTSLDPQYKKLPSKVFEASIHGIVPIKRELNDFCEIVNTPGTSWYEGTTRRFSELLRAASRCIFIPEALMSTDTNSIVLGDVYLVIDDKVVNLAEELEVWPGFAQKNKDLYIQNLSKFYTSRRIHHACLDTPTFLNSDLPSVKIENLTITSYNAICDNMSELLTKSDQNKDKKSYSGLSEDGGIFVIFVMNIDAKRFKLTPEEIYKLSNQYIVISGVEYNVLNVLVTKMRDLVMCDTFRDEESVGRARSKRLINQVKRLIK